MRLQLFGSFLFLSFASYAQEFDDLPDWARASNESVLELTKKKKQGEFEKICRFIQPTVRAAAIDWFRTKFCAISVNNITQKVCARDTILEQDIMPIMVATIGYDFVSLAFVMLINGVDIDQVSTLTIAHMGNALLQTQTEKVLATLIPNIATKPVWRVCEDCIRADIASRLIQVIQTIILPMLKASALECGKAAIIFQKKEDISLAHFNDNKYALNDGLSPKLIRLIKQRRNTK